MIDLIRQRLSNELPGALSHGKMNIKLEGNQFRNLKPQINYKNSSVLLIINKKYQILFTLRSENLNSHKGQISFPGGRVEANENPLQAALRETYEEIGIKENNLIVLGELSKLYVPPSNNLIHPFVAFLSDDLGFHINQNEVAEVFWIDIDYFLNKNNLKVEKWFKYGNYLEVPLWNIGKKAPLWGATAMILQEFIDIYKDL